MRFEEAAASVKEELASLIREAPAVEVRVRFANQVAELQAKKAKMDAECGQRQVKSCQIKISRIVYFIKNYSFTLPDLVLAI